MDFSWDRLEHAIASSLRVGHYLSQSLIGSYILGNRPDAETQKQLPPVSLVLSDLKELFERDYKNIEAGFYKKPKNLFPNPLDYGANTLKVFLDLAKVWERKKRKAVSEFSEDPDPSLPTYYKQNFHYQSDGYLSHESAEVYDHQVELVFAGGAEAMRRQALVPLYNFMKSRNSQEPVRMLDIACGTGTFMKDVKDNYPDIRLTGLDLSPHYLKKARQNLHSYTHVDFVEAPAETLPFKEEIFDIVSCIYLFHELPRRVRSQVVTEMKRVLKPGGLVIFEDSIQLGDKPAFDASLKLFPKNYHEPYYLDFIEHDLSELFCSEGFVKESSDLAYFSKVLAFKKST